MSALFISGLSLSYIRIKCTLGHTIFYSKTMGEMDFLWSVLAEVKIHFSKNVPASISNDFYLQRAAKETCEYGALFFNRKMFWWS